MFLWRWFKKLVFLGVLAVAIVWAANYKVDGKPLYQVAKGFLASDSFRQSFKDLKMMVGGLLKSLGEEIQEDVTEEDRKELDKLIEKEAKEKHGTDQY